MAKLDVLVPGSGSRVVTGQSDVALFGQPPEILKGLLNCHVDHFDTLVLSDVTEKDGSLVNNLEFPFYFFLFVVKPNTQRQKLRIVGDQQDINLALRLLRLTLTGPTKDELQQWQTPPQLRREWLAVSEHLALTDETGAVVPVEEFIEQVPFDNNVARAGSLIIERLSPDRFSVTDESDTVVVDLNEDDKIEPTYPIQSDYVPGGLVKLGLEVLGGASGFTPNEPCTGLALCYNGDYILIDSVPFLDHTLFSRGIAKNQVSAVFLTHLHDDHCSMMPLMLMPHRVEVITTREIFNMAMDKLSCQLGWQISVVREHFKLIEVEPDVELNYFGLIIKPHITVHSIPTVGATFSIIYKGADWSFCVVGDNNAMSAVRDMNKHKIVRDKTLKTLEHIYSDRFNLLVADGGAGDIHGDPADAMDSESDRVVFVHVDELPARFNTTFSLASSGKRYTIVEGDSSIYTSQVNHYLTTWLGRQFPNRWLRSLLADEEVRRYNQGDVIIAQGAQTKGYVYLILTGYCDVVQHDGSEPQKLAQLQAGDIMGEMASVTGEGVRNASVVAASPTTVCLFAEETFSAFIQGEEFSDHLLTRWKIRPLINQLPMFTELSSTAVEQLSNIAQFEYLDVDDRRIFDDNHWHLLVEGEVSDGDVNLGFGSEFGWLPFGGEQAGAVTCLTDSKFIRFRKETFERIRLEIPQVNYLLRKYRVTTDSPHVDWLVSAVSIY
ncbi:MAG: cyclic nucleotide-binding domain-containing protein [Pseudomonadota bacterium]